MHRILLLESVHEEAFDLLNERADVTVASSPDAVHSDDQLAKIEAIITRGRGQITSEFLERCPEMRVVARCGVGLDNVDVAAASRRNLPVVNAPGSTTVTLAEHTLLLVLALQRQLHDSVCSVKEDRWSARGSYQGDECAGKTLGIVGLGAIGERVARLAAAFDMEVLYWNRTAKMNVPFKACSFHEVLEGSDIVSLHVALTKETRGILGAAELGRMKKGASLVNTARGALVDPEAICASLESGALGGYAADGVDPEPPMDGDPLVHHPCSLITPHSGALTRSTYARMCVRTAKNVLKVLCGEDPEPGCIHNAREIVSSPPPSA